MHEAMPILIIGGCASVLGIVISTLAFRLADKTMEKIDSDSSVKDRQKR